ncbi:HEAT repeat domain-containing protein [Paenibacillus campi]|uniref:HEAT repeat domain-containing protein n=1 Tax=Paenibacillus campi TaxID=3106031 RepID=UPI002B0037CA|nr:MULTISPECIES: HEAT repeat domain-containing protein [unclassified Paenibacillus]
MSNEIPNEHEQQHLHTAPADDDTEEVAVPVTDGYELPDNYSQLKKDAHRQADWKRRLEAARALGQYAQPPIIDLLQHLLHNDPVTAVREEAHKQLRELGVAAELPERSNSELFNHMTKTLIRIKKSLPADHTYDDFKGKFSRMRADIYDAYEGEKGDGFDEWLRGRWEALDLTINPKRDRPKPNSGGNSASAKRQARK